MSAETPLVADIRLALGELRRASRMFRNNRGAGWLGPVVASGNNPDTGKFRAVIEPARRVEFGLVNGAHDLLGWTSVVITPEMVGRRVAVFTSMEVKDGARPSAEQQTWARNVTAAGGIAGFVHSPDEALQLVDVPGNGWCGS